MITFNIIWFLQLSRAFPEPACDFLCQDDRHLDALHNDDTIPGSSSSHDQRGIQATWPQWSESSLSTIQRGVKKFLKRARNRPCWNWQGASFGQSALSCSQSLSGLLASVSPIPLAAPRAPTCLTALYLISANWVFISFCLSLFQLNQITI